MHNATIIWRVILLASIIIITKATATTTTPPIPASTSQHNTIMSFSSSFNHLAFQRKVQAALQSVERTLELERKPRLAGDVEHTYGAKYELVNLTTNAAIIAYMNCLEKLGLTAEVLKSIDKSKPTTLRFESSTTCDFLKEVKVDVPVDRSYEVKEEENTKEGESSKTTTKTRVMKVSTKIVYVCWFAVLCDIYSATNSQHSFSIDPHVKSCRQSIMLQNITGR